MDEREEWEIEIEKRKILQDSLITDMRKNKFIDEITDGLGENIKKEPNTIHKKEKKTFLSKLKKIF
jgi:hypothetical protein